MPKNYEENEDGGEQRAPKTQLPRGTPASYADLLYKTRNERLRVQKKVDKLKGLENVLTDYFVNNLSKDSTGVAGRRARVQVSVSAKPIVKDWKRFYQHITRTGSFELLQRRVNERAVGERWEAKKQVPGVERFNVKKVSCTKIGK